MQVRGGGGDLLMNMDLNFFSEHRRRLVSDSVSLSCYTTDVLVCTASHATAQTCTLDSSKSKAFSL